MPLKHRLPLLVAAMCPVIASPEDAVTNEEGNQATVSLQMADEQ